MYIAFICDQGMLILKVYFMHFGECAIVGCIIVTKMMMRKVENLLRTYFARESALFDFE